MSADDTPASRPRPHLRQHALALALFIALAIGHTWPLVTDLAHLSRMDNADTELNAWAVSWIAHGLRDDPLRLFDANIFHPSRYALAFSEPLIPPGLIGAPLRWLGASPVLTYNALVLIGMVLTAMAMYALVLRFTGRQDAALVAGCLLAFNAHTLTRFAHLQAHHVEWLPLGLWALDRVLLGGARRDGLWLAVCVSFAAMTSGYLAVMVIVMLGVAFLTRTDRWFSRDGLTVARPLAGSTILASILCGLVLWPYAVAFEGAPLERSVGEVALYSATLRDYLTTAGRWHYALWSHDFYGTTADSLFPGLTALALASVGIVWYRTDRRRVWMCVAIGIIGLLLSLGPATPVYGWLCSVFPPARSLRAASRFGLLVLFATGILAAYGLAAIQHRVARRTVRTALAIACGVAVNLEAMRAPMAYVAFEGFSPLYTLIANAEEPGAVAEFPVHSVRRIDQNGSYVLASTVHWRPLVNGYSGVVPPSYNDIAARLYDFPSRAALDQLDRLGVRHLVVHPSAYSSARREQVIQATARRPELELIDVDPAGRRLYRLHSARPAGRGPSREDTH